MPRYYSPKPGLGIMGFYPKSGDGLGLTGGALKKARKGQSCSETNVAKNRTLSQSPPNLLFHILFPKYTFRTLEHMVQTQNSFSLTD